MTDLPERSGFNLSCPVPLAKHETVQIAHGGGGRLMNQLIEKLFLAQFQCDASLAQHDSACFDVPEGQLAFTTDSFTISPLFFPGGDIGSLCVHGTVNDLAMSGAQPVALSVGMIIEEGFPFSELEAITSSLAQAAASVPVPVRTGDTKVVEKGKGDGIFINTSGVGVVRPGTVIRPESIQSGDQIIISGDLGRHGMAVMAKREGLEFAEPLESDSAALVAPIMALIDQGVEMHCLRDLTRGGLASAANELAASGPWKLVLEEDAIPTHPTVLAACDLFGFDPCYVANEGRFLMILPGGEVDQALDILNQFPECNQAARVGQVEKQAGSGEVVLTTAFGTERVLDMLSGEQLPRIC